MCEKPFICLLLIWYILRPLKTFISAFVRACVCAEMRVSERREGGGNSRAVDLYHFCCCFYSFLFFFFTLRTVYVFWIPYKIDVISSNAYRSVVRMTLVFDLEIFSISKTLLQE